MISCSRNEYRDASELYEPHVTTTYAICEHNMCDVWTNVIIACTTPTYVGIIGAVYEFMFLQHVQLQLK